MLRKGTKLSLQNICHTMPHKTLIGVYLFILILDKKSIKRCLAAILFLKLQNNQLHFILTIFDNLCTSNSGPLWANLIGFVKSRYTFFKYYCLDECIFHGCFT